jgi:hypothetical protein
MFRYSLNFKNLLINGVKTNYNVRKYSSARLAKERSIESSAIRRSLKSKTEIPVVNPNLDLNSKVLMYNGLFVIFCSFCSAGVYYIDGKFSSLEKNTSDKFSSLEKNIASFEKNTNDKFINLEKNTNDKFINLEKNTNDKFANLEKSITGLERITNDKITNLERITNDKITNLERNVSDKFTNIEKIQSKNVKPEAVVKWW